MKIYLIIFFNFLAILSFGQFDTSGPINKELINCVVEIQKGSGETGSGFLVNVGERNLLITNKHIIGNWTPVDSLIYSDSIFIYPYSAINKEPSYLRLGIKIANIGKPLIHKVQVHPNPKIDIAIVDITTDISNLKLENTVFIDTSMLLNLDIAKTFLSYGSQVFTIGYPAGIKAFKTNQPLIKSGTLASSLDGKLIMEQNWLDRKGKSIKTLTDGKIFIVDGLIIPGNSGGPVIISQEVVWFTINGRISPLTNLKNYFIGIVSNVYSNTGLATIFSSDNILELIRQLK